MQVYLVGGAVRDTLLKLPVTEKDWVVVGSTPQEMLASGFKQVGKDFPVFLHPETGEEYALARTERKSGKGYKGFEVHAGPEVTLEQDLKRRDLTINAIAQTSDGTLIDPYDGQHDLQQGLLRHVSPAFEEDPVRILRIARFAARFSQWGFHVAHDTHHMMQHMVEKGEVEHLVAERVWNELAKALVTKTPVVFFEVLRSCAALQRLFPEIEKLFGVAQPAKYHPEIDTGIHTFMVLKQAAALTDNPKIRFSALVHDLGKGETPPEILPSHKGHEQRSVNLINGLCERYRIPNDYRDLAVMVARYHSNCHRVQELRPATILDMLDQLDAFRRVDRFKDFLLACEADARGRKGMEENAYPQAAYLLATREAAAKITAGPLVAEGLQGEKIGERLRKLRIEAIKSLQHSLET